MSTQPRICASLFSLLLISGGCGTALAQTPASREDARIDEARITTLAGNVHPMARAEFDQGTVNEGTSLQHMVFQLKPSEAQQAELDALVEAQPDPQSPLYHQWLTPAQYGARFGVSRQDLDRITGWLAGHGFAVGDAPISNRLIFFSGTAGQGE